MNTPSVPQTRTSANPEMGVEGAATCRLTGPATGGIPWTQDHQAEGSSLPPPLQPLSTKAALLQAHQERCAAITAKLAAVSAPATTPGHQLHARPAQEELPLVQPSQPADGGALREPVPAGEPKATPISRYPQGTSAQTPGRTQNPGGAGGAPPADLGAAGQRLLHVDGLPLTTGQRSLDGTWTEPPSTGGTPCIVYEAPVGAAQVPLPLPGLFEVPGQGVMFELFGAAGVRFQKPPRGIEGEPALTFKQRVAWAAMLWCWGVDVMRCNHHQRSEAFAARRARLLKKCGKRWVTGRKHKPCGNTDQSVVHPLDTCDSRGCCICARRRSKQLRQRLNKFAGSHPNIRRHGMGQKISRGWFFHTITVPMPDYVSVECIQQQFTLVKKALKKLWGKGKGEGIFRYLPRADDGTCPGECPEWGGFATIEVGPHGNVHVHILRYGAWQSSVTIRELLAPLGIKWTRDVAVHGGKNGKSLSGAVREVTKYMTKASVKPGRTHGTHNLVAFLGELALQDAKLYRTWGSMSGLADAADKKTGDELQAEEDHEWTCPHCGGAGDYEDIISDFDEPTVPAAWTQRRSQAPPGGSPPGGAGP